ncbi:MAG TPA: glycosyltransferase [Gemmatimonadaceae bacterium]|nr:glycosyltransferase [Gemmatimonadaceae bacterium]
MTRLRLLQVTEDLGMGGLEQVVATICRNVDRERFEPAVVCLRNKGPLADQLEDEGVRVFLLDSPPGKPDYFAFRRVARLIRERGFDVVHTHNTQAFMDGGLGAKLAGVPTLVHTDHARIFPDKRRYMFAEHVLSHLAYRVVGVSEDTSANLVRYEKISREKLLTIPNGIDGRRYNVTVDAAAKRRELGLPAEGPVIGLGARLTPQKGLIHLLRAMAVLQQRVPNLSCVIAGEGELDAELKSAARELGVDDRVRFVGMRLDLPQLLKVFDLYVLPSEWEGLPMAILEAMGSGCPIVATDVGGLRTAIESDVNGRLVPPRDPQALADAIAGLLASPETRRRYAAEAKGTFHERFSAEAMTRRYEKLYLRQAERVTRTSMQTALRAAY